MNFALTPPQKEVRDRARLFARQEVAPLARQTDESGEFPLHLVARMGELGFLAGPIDPAYGGSGMDYLSFSLISEELGRVDSSVRGFLAVHAGLFSLCINDWGTEAQKQRYLPRLAKGEIIGCYCLTEPNAGSDAAGMETAVRQENGAYILNGEKIWITNGGIADFYTVFARTDSDAGKISAFIVERDSPGVSIGLKEDKLGIRSSSTTTVSFADVEIPAENLLGEEGKGFKMAMAILNNGRTGLSGGAVGGMKTCIALASKQAVERKQFGRSIAEFGLIKKKIAEMTVDCFAAESAVRMVSHYIDSGYTDYSVEAAISKVFASEAMFRAANESLQIAAGNGFMKEFPYERIMRDSRILTIFEGTSEILRLFIALSGMKDAGVLLQELKSATDDIFNNPIKGFGLLSDYAGRRITHVTSLGQDRIIAAVPEVLRDDALVFEKYTLELARMTDVLLRRHGKSIIEKQFALQRAADVVIDLFVGLSVLSRVSAMTPDDSEQYQQALSIAHIFSQRAKRRMNRNLRAMLRNEDEAAKSLADYIFDKESYPWDVL